MTVLAQGASSERPDLKVVSLKVIVWVLITVWVHIRDCVQVRVLHKSLLFFVGIGDKSSGGQHGGCVDLLNTVLHRVKPKFHVFGHIHEGYGMYTDGTTTFINASSVDRYRPRNQPIVFDIDLPPGKSKDELIKFLRETIV